MVQNVLEEDGDDNVEFTPLEQKSAEAFIILQRLLAKLHYWNTRKIVTKQAAKRDEGNDQ